MKRILILFLISAFPVLARPLTIETTQGTLKFDVQEATTPKEREQGLKFVRHLPEFGGMVFWFPKPSRPTFWMQDTPISLDMIFFDATGKIVQIEPNCVPFSEKNIPARQPVKGVLEIGGGLTKKHHIRLGDQLTF